MNTLAIYMLPYCLRRLAPGQYILLNRNYKTIGTLSTDWQDYEKVGPILDLSFTPRQAVRLSCKKSAELDHIHLYCGWDISADVKGWPDYCKRLKVLSARIARAGVGDRGRGKVCAISPLPHGTTTSLFDPER
jgi:hypothetical protein